MDEIRKRKITMKNIPLMEIFVVIFYIINQYSLGSLSLGFILMGIMVVFMFIKTRKLRFYYPLLFLFVYMLMHDIMKNIIVSVNAFSWLEKILYFVFLGLIIGNIDKEKFYSVYRKVGAVVMAGLFVQSVQVYILGQSVKMINILPFLNSDSENFTKEYMRPHSFMLEPAAYVSWIMPLLIMTLQKRKLKYAIIITISILLSSSVTGILFTIFVWLYYCFTGLSNYETRRSSLIMLTVIVFGIFSFTSMSIFSTSMDKLTNTSVDDTSNSVRTTLGFELYKQLNLGQQLFGIPYTNAEEYMKSGVVNLRDYGLNEDLNYLGFVNSMSNCLLNYGMLGAILYIFMFFSFFRKTEKKQRAYVMLCFFSTFAQSAFWNSLFVIQISFMLICLSDDNMFLIVGEKEREELYG